MARIPRQVIVTELDGAERTYPSAKAAAEYIDCPQRSVRNAIQTGYLLFGYRVRYAGDPKPINNTTERDDPRCRFNRYVNCPDPGLCDSCGWNPDVKERRIHGGQ